MCIGCPKGAWDKAKVQRAEQERQHRLQTNGVEAAKRRIKQRGRAVRALKAAR